METEKVCVNLPAAELGKLDVLVAQGLYSSRTDVIRAGIRNLLVDHEDAVQMVTHDATRIGYQLLTRHELELAKRAKSKLNIFVIGVLRIQANVTAALADQTIESIRIFGSVKGPDEVVEALGPRIIRGISGGM